LFGKNSTIGERANALLEDTLNIISLIPGVGQVAKASVVGIKGAKALNATKAANTAFATSIAKAKIKPTPRGALTRPKVAAPSQPSAALELYRPSTEPLTKTITNKIKTTFGELEDHFTADLFESGEEYLSFGLGPSFRNIFEMEVGKPILDIPLNPFAISGTSPNSPRAVKITNDWLHAHQGFIAEKKTQLGIKSNQTSSEIRSRTVDALLYKGSRGDMKAMAEFNRLVGVGMADRKMLKASDRSFARQFQNEDFYENILKMLKSGRFTNIKLDDLFLVHETSHPLKMSANGNGMLYPTSQYQTAFVNNHGKTPDMYEYVRDTIHFALNHIVAGHDQREALAQGSNIIIAKLTDVLRANPGSLDNLYGIDTFLTPAPGKPIILPKGSFKTFEKGIDPFTQLQDVMLSMMSPSKASKFDLTRFDGFDSFPYMFYGETHGLHSSQSHVSKMLVRIAKKLGVPSARHFDHPSSNYSQNFNFSNASKPEDFLQQLFQMSPNARARIFARKGLHTVFDDQLKREGLFSGLEYFRRDKSGFFNGGIVPKFESQGVPAMLHGGEYVVNAKAVKNIGFAALEAMNNMRYNTPKSPSYSATTNQPTNSNSNVNIYVDNFIGERAWFESMMKDYNVKVAPQNQKSAGLNNTTISTYSGINRGL
jgi:hypothetical protein